MDDLNIQFDYEGILRVAVDKAVTEFVTSFIPDKKDKKIIAGMITIYRKYGIDAQTSLKIINDLGELLKEVESKE